MDKVEAIQNCNRPSTKKEVWSLLGLVGWYRRFVPQFATVAAPLTALTCKDQRNPVTWTDECEEVFSRLQPHISGSGGCLSSRPWDSFGTRRPWRGMFHTHRKQQPPETRYSTVEKEGLAIKWALESLHYLLGREFDLEIDHRALSWIDSRKDHNSRLTQWYLLLQPSSRRLL